jgi:hypothetical protein
MNSTDWFFSICVVCLTVIAISGSGSYIRVSTSPSVEQIVKQCEQVGGFVHLDKAYSCALKKGD